MTAPTNNQILSKAIRAYVGNTATASTDTAFTRVENENNLQIKFSAATQDYVTKSVGRITTPGDVGIEIKIDFAEALTDTGLPLMIGALNQVWNFQIRDDSATPGHVWIEGPFIVSDVDYKADAKGLREGTATLKSAGAITLNAPTRVVS